MKSAPLFTTFVLAGMTAFASAGQRFTFADPISNGSYANSMFQTTNLFADLSSSAAGISNFYTGNVMLVVDTFTSTGAYVGTTSTDAKYYLSKTAANANGAFSGSQTSGAYATGIGQMIFVNPLNEAQTLLRVSFTQSLLTYGNFAAAGNLTFAGGALSTGEIGSENARFILPDRFTTSTSTTLARHTASFTASIGTIGTIPVPEPAPIAALSFGALLLIRRRRRV